MPATTAALVGATGGAGTTRTTVEMAAALARDGRDVAVLDAAFATQGLGDYVEGTLDPDLTALVTDRAEDPLTAGLVDPAWGTPGRVVVCPSAAPFERLARAKTVEAARTLESRIDEATADVDHVLVDTPPVADNPAVAAVTACERVAVVAPATPRGDDAVQRLDGRLADLGVDVDAVVTTRGTLAVGDARIPESETHVATTPVCASPGAAIAPAVGDVVETVLDVDLAGVDDRRGVVDRVGDFVN